MKIKVKIPTNGRGGVPLPKSDAKAVVNLAKDVEKFLKKHQQRMQERIQQQLGGGRNAQGTGRAAQAGGEQVRQPRQAEA